MSKLTWPKSLPENWEPRIVAEGDGVRVVVSRARSGVPSLWPEYSDGEDAMGVKRWRRPANEFEWRTTASGLADLLALDVIGVSAPIPEEAADPQPF